MPHHTRFYTAFHTHKHGIPPFFTNLTCARPPFNALEVGHTAEHPGLLLRSSTPLTPSVPFHWQSSESRPPTAGEGESDEARE